MNDKFFKIAFVIVSLSFLWTLLRQDVNRLKVEKKNIELVKMQYQRDSLQKLCDSIDSENFPCQIELSRYETAYQIFMRRNPKAAEQFGTIISDETE